MKVSLKNVGMLDEAEFEVGNLTIICGENNTGKTYATYSLYGYLDFMRSIRGIPFFRFGSKIINSNNSKRQVKKKRWTYTELKEELETYIKNKTKSYKQYKLAEFMAGKEDDFGNSSFDCSFNVSVESIKNAIKNYLESEEVSLNTRYKANFDHIVYSDGLEIRQKDLYQIRDAIEHYTVILFDSILTIILPQNFILSVERTGASIFQQELDFNKIAQMEMIKKIIQDKEVDIFDIDDASEREQLYPKPVRDNIKFIRNLRQKSKKNSIFQQYNSDLYTMIIKSLGQLVGGKYRATDVGVLFQPKGSRKSYGIEIASSSVRSLLMLNYYILNIAQKGDILMIDEPELNLHPKNQILMGRLIALLVNAGIKVFITTHSDYIVREISNCIMLNNLSSEQIGKFNKKGYTKEYQLESNKVKAYMADRIRSKNTLIPIKVDSRQGIFMNSFDEPIDSQNKNQGLIFEEILKEKKYDK